METLIIDATEQPIERPKKDQKPCDSGKKKRHTLKTKIRMNDKGCIVLISKSHPSFVHDFNVFKEGKTSCERIHCSYGFSGYQWIDAIHNNAHCPCKSSKNKHLDDGEKSYNQLLSSIHVAVEHVFAHIKTFRILSYPSYRNKRKRYNIKFRIIAGLVNLKNGFSFA